MITIQAILQHAKQQLREAGIPSASLDAELLLAHVLEQSREYLLRHYDQELPQNVLESFAALLARRLKREPMSHLLGKREFYGREFIVTRDTLDPRPDSETLIEAVLKHFPERDAPLNILDIGVGTGCLLLTFLAEYTKAYGVGTDISEPALAVSEQNGQALGLQERVMWKLQNGAQAFDKSFDIIVSNPPYIPEDDISELEKEVAEFEPKLALDGGADGLDCYRTYAPAIEKMLKPNGMVALEIGQGQENDVKDVFKMVGLKHQASHKDLAGIIRVMVFEKK